MSERRVQPGHALDGLHVCPLCRSTLMEPVEWLEAPQDRWALVLRCPECGSRTQGIFSNAEVQRYAEQLDRATEQMVRQMQELDREVFAAEAECFITAMWADAVHPMDF